MCGWVSRCTHDTGTCSVLYTHHVCVVLCVCIRTYMCGIYTACTVWSSVVVCHLQSFTATKHDVTGCIAWQSLLILSIFQYCISVSYIVCGWCMRVGAFPCTYVCRSRRSGCLEGWNEAQSGPRT